MDATSAAARGPVRRVRVHPGPLAGRLHVPGDKSISHRSLLFGALVGRATVTGVAPSGDVLSTAECLRSLGVDVDLVPTADGMLGGAITGRPVAADARLDCGNSGTGMRLLAGLCAALPSTSTLVGDESLSARPMGRIATPLRQMGATVELTPSGTPPVVVAGGDLRPIEYASPVASAQVKSCILLAAAGAGVTATIVSPLASRDHTERMLRGVGARVERDLADDGTETVRLVSGPTADDLVVAVPGDPSSAAFWLVAAVAGGRDIAVVDVATNDTRTGVVTVLREMGADVTVQPSPERGGEPVGTLTARADGLDGGITIGGRTVVDAIDELPVLALAGALSAKGLEVRDAAELRAKESDRIDATAAALGALGIEVEQRPDGFVVPGGQRPGPGRVDARGDHRIAMTAAIAATVGTGPVEIDGFASVATSYPSFLADLRRLGGDHEVLDD